MVTFNRLNADPDITGSDQVPVYDSGSNRLRKGTMTQIAEFVRTSLGLANELVEEAPDDGFIYGRQNKAWTTISKDDAGKVVPLIAPRQTGDGVKLEFDSPIDYAADPRGFFVQVDGITQRPTSPNSVADYSINENGKVVFTEAVPDGALVDIRFFQPSTEATDRTNDTVIANGSTTARTLGSRFADVVNVKDFGAIGDGVADDTVAIQAALTVGGSVVIPSGTYKTTSALTTAKPCSLSALGHVEFIGDASLRFTLIRPTDNFKMSGVKFTDYDNGVHVVDSACKAAIDYIEVSNCISRNTQVPVLFDGLVSNTSTVRKVAINNCDFDGWVYGFRHANSPAIDSLIITENTFTNGSKSAILGFASNDDAAYTNKLIDVCVVSNNSINGINTPIGDTTNAETIYNLLGEETHGILIKSNEARIIGNSVEQLDAERQRGVEGIYTKCKRQVITGNTCYNAHRRQAAITVKGGDSAVVSGNNISMSDAYKASFSPVGGDVEGWGIYTQDVLKSLVVDGNSIFNSIRAVGIRIVSDCAQTIISNNTEVDSLKGTDNITIFDYSSGGILRSAKVFGNKCRALSITGLQVDDLTLADNTVEFNLQCLNMTGTRIASHNNQYGKLQFSDNAGTFNVPIITIRDDVSTTSSDAAVEVYGTLNIGLFSVDGLTSTRTSVVRWTSASDPANAVITGSLHKDTLWDLTGSGRTPANAQESGNIVLV